MGKPVRIPWIRLVALAVFFLGAFCLGGCRSPGPLPELTPTLMPSLSPSPLPSTPAPATEVSDQPQPLATPIPVGAEKPLYTIRAALDYANHRVDVEQRILVPHPGQEALFEIDLVVPPNIYPGVFSIQDLQSVNIPLESYSLAGVRLGLQFADPGWVPGQDLELEISFGLDLPRMNSLAGYGPSAFGYSDLQTNLVDWYPMVPPYQAGAGWIIHDPWIFGEYLVFPAADFEVILAVGSPDLIVAASAEAVEDPGELRYSLKDARNFVFSASPSYAIWEGSLEGTTIREYYFPGYQVPAQAALEAALEAWELYSELYGPNDQALLSIIQGDFNHGLEYEGVFFQGRGYYDTYTGSQESYLVAISVHETAHQWWYGQVANDQALEPWLDEALCTFSELAYYENLYPESLDWWWYTRVNYYQPVGDLEGSIYSFTEFQDQYLMYRNATYLQGAKFLSELKADMGEEDFYTFLQEYSRENRDRIATGAEFFSTLDRYLDLSSQSWIREYFPAHPALD